MRVEGLADAVLPRMIEDVLTIKYARCLDAFLSEIGVTVARYALSLAAE